MSGRPVPSARMRPVSPLLVKREEAAKLLGGMSIDTFERHVQPELRLIRVGSLVLVPVKELERWVAENQMRTLEPAA
jgi:hypothetical protein